MTEANERQVAGTHYKAEYQHWDWVSDIDLPYLPAQVTKYIVRWKKKNGRQDLEKALHFLEKLIEVETYKQEALIADTVRFIDNNSVEDAESHVITNIANYYGADLYRLDRARDIIKGLIDSTLV